MIKVFNAARLRRMREAKERNYKRAYERFKQQRESARTYSRGDLEKNANLMLDALTAPIRRKMIARVRREGAMSLTKLAEPFNLTLPGAYVHLRILERSGIVSTRKQGRTRICYYRVGALKELAKWLESNGFQHE